MKREQGITLISLVVTIIVLIILAGISVNLILGQDGIINKAKEAKQNMEYAQIEEQEQLNEVYEYLELGTIGIGSSNDKIQEIVSKYETLKTEYTNFKETVANAITEEGIQTSKDADATTMVSNIKNILSNNEKEEYLIGTPYTYTVDGGITATVYSNQQIKMVRNSQSACGITISDVDLTNYKTVKVEYNGLTSGIGLQLKAGDLSNNNTSSSGTIELDVTEIKTTASIKVALGGANGQVYISSLKLIP